MIFTSITFVVFFPAVLLLLGLIRGARGRIWLLLVASYVFYGNWNAYYVLLIFAYGLWGWGLGLAMHDARNPALKKFFFVLSLVLSLGTLAWFKYANFFGENIARLLGTRDWVPIDIVLGKPRPQGERHARGRRRVARQVGERPSGPLAIGRRDDVEPVDSFANVGPRSRVIGAWIPKGKIGGSLSDKRR